MPLRLTSVAFRQGGDIPKKYTCDGDDVSPPFAWSGAPEGTRSFLLICDDPDAPAETFHHWAAFDIPPGPYVVNTIWSSCRARTKQNARWS